MGDPHPPRDIIAKKEVRMEISLFIAKILGPLFLIVAVSMLLNRAFFMKAMDDYCGNAALMYFSALFPLAFGIVVVLLHNVWEASWRVLITIFAWGGIIKGVIPLMSPGTVPKFMRAYQKNKVLWIFHAIAAIGFGAVFTFFGFFGG